MDFQRAVQAYPVGLSGRFVRVDPGRGQAGPGHRLQRLGIADNFVDPKAVWLTANDTTIYAFVNIDLAKVRSCSRSRPGPSSACSTTSGSARSPTSACPGPTRAMAASFFCCRPATTAKFLPGYYMLRATMNNHNLLVRGIIVDNDVPAAVARIRNVKVYPWSERDNPKPNKFVSISGKAIDTIPPGGIEFWARLVHVHQQQPRSRARPVLHGHAQAAGHRERQAVQARRAATRHPRGSRPLGDAMARNVMFDAQQRISGATAFPGTRWDWVFS